MKTSTSKIFFSIIGIILSLVFAGCSKDDPEKSMGKRISKITQTADAKIIVKDAESGAIISEESVKRVIKEQVFIWEGDILKKYTSSFAGELLHSLNYAYSDGKLAQVVDDVDGSVTNFFYSNHLDRLEWTCPSYPKEIIVFSYDENERVKSLESYLSDGSSIYDDIQLAKLRFEFSYKGNNVSSLTQMEYHYVDDTEPFFMKTTDVEYSAAINPLKGIYTEALWGNYRYVYFSDNLYCNYLTYNTEGTIGKEKGEVRYDNDKYPVETIFDVDDYNYCDGMETIYQGYIIESYEYLD